MPICGMTRFAEVFLVDACVLILPDIDFSLAYMAKVHTWPRCKCQPAHAVTAVISWIGPKSIRLSDQNTQGDL